MHILPGVFVVDAPEHAQAVQRLLDAPPAGIAVHVVDTFANPAIANPGELLEAVARALGVAEWFGYGLPVILAEFVAAARGPAVLALAFSPQHAHLLDRGLLAALSTSAVDAGQHGRSFQTVIFEHPIGGATARL